ncbi:MAG TPA: hypothetical protein VFX69_13205 [Steroidobacteraceae bacterium]|nr:hypothetical protein [Steroidobacteraceae bacterium]
MCQKITAGSTRATVRLACCAWLAATGLGASTTALGDDAPDLLTDPFHLAVGTFIISTEPTVQLNGETVRGDRVDFDSVMGGGDATRVRLDADWRFGDTQRHKVRAIAFAMSRERRKTIDEEIEWGGDTYPVNAKLEAELKFSVVELAYEYAFLRRDTYELGGSIGLHYTTFDAGLRAKSTSTGQSLDLSNEASVNAPLPVIGLRGLWKFPANLYVDAQAQFFALSIDEYDGSVQDYRLMLTWQPKSWLGVGIGYNSFKIDVDVEKDRFDGSLDWTYDGPMIFYSASF